MSFAWSESAAIPVMGGQVRGKFGTAQTIGQRAVLFCLPGAWTPVCSYCIEHAAYEMQGLAAFALVTDPLEGVVRWAKEMNGSLPIVADYSGEIVKLLGVRGDNGRAKRCWIIFDSDGNEVMREYHEGNPDWEAVRAALRMRTDQDQETS